MDYIKFHGFQYVSALSATFELKMRILYDLIRNHKEDLELDKIEEIIFAMFANELSLQDCSEIRGARQIRNCILHCKFRNMYKETSRFFGGRFIEFSRGITFYEATSAEEIVDSIIEIVDGKGVPTTKEPSVYIGALALNSENTLIQLQTIFEHVNSLIEGMITIIAEVKTNEGDSSYYYLLKKKFTYYFTVCNMSAKDSWEAAYLETQEHD